MVDWISDKPYDLGGSILGFAHLREFRIQLVEPDSPYCYIQSMEDENIGFLAVSPFFFTNSYEFELDDADKETLEVRSQDDVYVLGLVTVHNPFKDSTVNLAAPIVLNTKKNVGKQIVLPPQYEYPTKYFIFPKTADRSGGASC